jgi:hypothetical protein
VEIEWVRGKLAQRRTGRWVGPSKEELARPAPKYKAACGDVQHPASSPARCATHRGRDDKMATREMVTFRAASKSTTCFLGNRLRSAFASSCLP